MQELLRRVLRALPWTRLLPQGRAPRIEAVEAMRAIEAGDAVLLDVREHRELSGGLAEPALWMPMSEFSRSTPAWCDFVESLSRDKRVIVYCAAGVRAGRIADALADLGFDTANLGAYHAWQAVGLPTRAPEATRREPCGQGAPDPESSVDGDPR
jgi:rhodanese-related sulfurtransferase